MYDNTNDGSRHHKLRINSEFDLVSRFTINILLYFSNLCLNDVSLKKHVRFSIDHTSNGLSRLKKKNFFSLRRFFASLIRSDIFNLFLKTDTSNIKRNCQIPYFSDTVTLTNPWCWCIAMLVILLLKNNEVNILTH